MSTCFRNSVCSSYDDVKLFSSIDLTQALSIMQNIWTLYAQIVERPATKPTSSKARVAPSGR